MMVIVALQENAYEAKLQRGEVLRRPGAEPASCAAVECGNCGYVYVVHSTYTELNTFCTQGVIKCGHEDRY